MKIIMLFFLISLRTCNKDVLGLPASNKDINSTVNINTTTDCNNDINKETAFKYNYTDYEDDDLFKEKAENSPLYTDSQEPDDMDYNYPDEDNSTTLPPIMDCECAVFDTMFPNNTDIPILTQIPSYIDCENGGEEDCIALCSILAKSAISHGPELICSFGDYTLISPSVHSRVLCNSNNTWIYTGLTATDEICCQKNRVVNCKDSMERDNKKNCTQIKN